VGDYYLAQGLLTAIDNNEFEYLRILSNTVKRMSEGELLALEKSKTIFIDEATYFEIASNKTASLLATCSEVGAVSANASVEERAKLAEYGEKIGLAFQLQDDVLDYVSNHSIIGKPTGNDIKEKKITLPLIKALDNGNETEKKQIIKLIKQDKITKKDVQFIIDFTIQNGGIDYTKQCAMKFAEEAKTAISTFPDGLAKTALLELADFVYLRDK
jgi:octaprenyl-diphosphate synthase